MRAAFETALYCIFLGGVSVGIICLVAICVGAALEEFVEAWDKRRRYR